jgi:hypothetical protein
LIGTFKGVGEMLADAIIKSATAASHIPTDLYTTLQSLPGFDESHVDDYFDYFVENPSKARAFMQLPFSILNLVFVGDGSPQWLATGALEHRPAVALLAGPGAPQPNLIERLIVHWATDEILKQRAWAFPTHTSSALNGRVSFPRVLRTSRHPG